MIFRLTAMTMVSMIVTGITGSILSGKSFQAFFPATGSITTENSAFLKQNETSIQEF